MRFILRIHLTPAPLLEERRGVNELIVWFFLPFSFRRRGWGMR
jgi:hypothetical protein